MRPARVHGKLKYTVSRAVALPARMTSRVADAVFPRNGCEKLSFDAYTRELGVSQTVSLDGGKERAALTLSAMRGEC